MFLFTPIIALKNKWFPWWLSVLAVAAVAIDPDLQNRAPIHEQVLICGVCRNIESRLEKTIEIMESIGAFFEDYRILVYENNSTDRTPELLSSWAYRNPKVWLRSEYLSQGQLGEVIININQDGSFFVPEQIARARNIVLDEALSAKYEAFSHLIWMDMDFVRFPDFDGFIDTFQSSREWDAVFAYGVDPDNIFWDWYALRDKNYPLGSELLGMDWWSMPKKLSLAKGDPWYPVYSAFGGCGIYKKASIEGCRYSAIVTQDLATISKQLIKSSFNAHDSSSYFGIYLHLNAELQKIYKIESPQPNLPPIFNPAIGIVLHGGPDALIWRMSTHAYQYPSVCEHVPFHASMSVRGHDKLYINPKLIFRYGD